MKSPRIAIVTYNWPPRNAIGTHRPYSWAKYWAELGAKVTVVTAKKEAHDEPLDLVLPEIEGVKVIEIPYMNRFASSGTTFLKNSQLRRVVKKINAKVTSSLGVSVDVRSGWRNAAVSTIQELANQMDFVVSTFGPAASHLIAFDMKQHNPNLYWVADYRDLWSQRGVLDVSKKQRSRMQRLEKSTVGVYADKLVSVSEGLVEKLTQLTGKTVFLSPNGFDLEEDQLKANLSKTQERADPLHIVYTGTIYNNMTAEPLLTALVEMLAAGQVQKGMVTVDFYGSRTDHARNLASRPEYEPFIRIMGHVPREKALDVQRNAGLLLLLLGPSSEAQGVLTGKVFEYMTSGTPILCLGSKKEYELPQLLRKSGTGMSVEKDVDEIKRVLLSVLEPNSNEVFYQPNIECIMQYSRRRQAIALYHEILR